MYWNIDPTHSTIRFTVKHMLVTSVRGSFTDFSGIIHFDEGAWASSWVEVEMAAPSITTNEATRDGFLRSPEFFDVLNFPVIAFKSNRVEPAGERHARVTGDLTIRGITREVSVEAEYAGMDRRAARIRFHGQARFNRKDFGLAWNQVLETGGMLVGDEIKVSIELQAVPAEVANLLAEQEASASA